MPEPSNRPFFGWLLFIITLFFGLLGGGVEYRAAGQQTAPGVVQVGTSTPIISGFVINQGNPIILTANGTASITVSYVVTDQNGCPAIFYNGGNVTTTLFRSGVSSTCATSTPGLNYQNCYYVATTTNNCPGPNSTTTSANVTTTFTVWYFAQSTADTSTASSSYPGQSWLAYAIAQDTSSTTGASTSASGVNLWPLLAISANPSSTNYGTVAAGLNTGAADQVSSVLNVGNATTTVKVYASSTLVSGGNTITTSSQHYATSTFTYNSSDTVLTGAATLVSGFLAGAVPLGGWATTTPFLNPLQWLCTTAYSNYLYTIGGFGSAATSTVSYAPINSTGSIGAWTSTTPLPYTYYDHTGVASNGFIYIVGGWASSTYTSTVFYAPINSTGSIGAWTSTSPLPIGIYNNSSALYNGFIYSLGGNGAARTSSVFYAPIGATGSLGTWTTTTPLPGAIEAFSAGAYNGYLYALGGNNSAATSTVSYAPINSTGSIGAWTSTTPLPTGTNQFAAIVSNGMIYAVAGLTPAGNPTSTVYYAPLSANGSVGVWAQAQSLSTNLRAHSGTSYNGYVYITGGYNGSTQVNTVYYASLPTRNTYWGLAVPNGTPVGTYTGANTYIAVYSP